MSQSSFNSTELPGLQPHSHCVLIARDPNFIYAYWDYTQQDIDRARRQLGSSEDVQLILRVYDITNVDFNGSNANYTWDINVGFATKDWYVHVCQDNADYCARLWLERGGHFIPLQRSNVVRTPPNSSSSRNDLIWQDIKVSKESLPYIEEEIRQGKKKLYKGKPSKKSRFYYLTAKDIRDYYMNLFARVSRKGRRSSGQVPSIEEILKGKLRGMSLQRTNPVLTSPDLIRRCHPGSSMGFQAGGSSQRSSALSGGASEGRLLNKRKFFFEIWAELIVHGRTEADAAVWLNEKGIKLNPDGTFTLRYSLPDGEIPFKFMARSADTIEQRHISTRVEREKTTNG